MLQTAEVYVAALDRFLPLPPMTAPRGEHTATPLADGRVLLAGGYTVTAEIFDPASDQFTRTAGSMSQSRTGHTATRLADGRVLLAGGFSGSVFGGGLTDTAEIFDPATGSFTPTAPKTTPRYRHAAALLPDGRVLVTGGWNGRATLATAELYDPVRGVWTPVAPMAGRRVGHTITRLPDSTLLVAGGRFAAVAERFDPVTGRFLPTGLLAEPRQSHTATLLPAGRVLIVGGYGTSPLASAEQLAPESLAP
jgi:hypothetical protein